MGDAGERLQTGRDIGEFRAEDQCLGRRVVTDELQFRHRQPPVQRQKDGAEPLAGELDFEDVGIVVAQHRDPVARLYPQRVKIQRQPGDAAVEAFIGEPPVRCEIVYCRALGRNAGVVRNPVGGGRHCFSPVATAVSARLARTLGHGLIN